MKVPCCSNIKIYTDGSCLKNPGGAGGYAAIVINEAAAGDVSEVVVRGGDQETTNNRMEMLAAIAGLDIVQPGVTVDIYSDSQYLINGFKKGWVKSWKRRGWKTASKQPVKNQDLWMELDRLCDRPGKVTWHWVKGHNGDEYNERCDQIAREEAEKNIACAGQQGLNLRLKFEENETMEKNEPQQKTVVLYIKPGYGEELEKYNLLPCPFCGDKEHLEIKHLNGTVQYPAYKVRCDTCGASVDYTDGNCIEDWNTRHAYQEENK